MGGSLVVGVMGLQADVRAWHARVKERNKMQGKTTIERIVTSREWPKLKAKGAATRHLIAYGVFLAKTSDNGAFGGGRALQLVLFAVATEGTASCRMWPKNDFRCSPETCSKTTNC